MKKAFIFLCTCLLSSAIYAQSCKDLLILSSFSQGEANNCASVALIKAAMLKYGYKNMFALVRHETSYEVTLKNDTRFAITKQQLDSAIVYARFKTPDLLSLGAEKDSVLFYAYIAYASIAKFVAINGYWGCEEAGAPHRSNHNTYGDALDFISNTSFCTDYCYRLLGYKAKENKIYDFTKTEELLQPGTIVYSSGHAVAVYKDYIDCHGSWEPVTTKSMCSNYFKWYIVLE